MHHAVTVAVTVALQHGYRPCDWADMVAEAFQRLLWRAGAVAAVLGVRLLATVHNHGSHWPIGPEGLAAYGAGWQTDQGVVLRLGGEHVQAADLAFQVWQLAADDPGSNGGRGQGPGGLQGGWCGGTMGAELSRVSAFRLQIGQHRGIGLEALGQAGPATRLAGYEQRAKPDPTSDRLDQQPGPPMLQCLLIAGPQVAAQVAVGGHHGQRLLAVHAHTNRAQQISQRSDVRGADGANGDRCFCQAAGGSGRIDLLLGPQG